MSFGFGGMEVTGLVESSFSGVVRGEARLEQFGSNGRRGSRDKCASTAPLELLLPVWVIWLLPC